MATWHIPKELLTANSKTMYIISYCKIRIYIQIRFWTIQKHRNFRPPFLLTSTSSIFVPPQLPYVISRRSWPVIPGCRLRASYANVFPMPFYSPDLACSCQCTCGSLDSTQHETMSRWASHEFHAFLRRDEQQPHCCQDNNCIGHTLASLQFFNAKL